MKRTGNNNNSNSTPSQDESAPKRQRREVAEIINGTLAALEIRADEHDQSMKEARGKIEEVCNALREAIDDIEKYLIDTLQQGYTKEDERLHKMIHEMRELGSNILDNNNNKGEYLNKEEEKDLNKLITEADGILCYMQEYSVKRPECEDVGRWARDVLGDAFEVCVSQSLCRERLEGRTPRITSVTATGPNEVCIDFEFLHAEEEEAALRGVGNSGRISYKVEMWNGEEGEYDVRSVQCIGPSHKASVEWRLISGSECKVRVRAVWRGASGEECLSEWGEWATFTVPSKHKNSGAVRAGVAWAKGVSGETYTIAGAKTNRVLYTGTKPYAILPQCPRKRNIVIAGRKGEAVWEKKGSFGGAPETPENLFEDLRLFHTDKDACLLALNGISKSTELSDVVIEDHGGLEAISNTIRNYIDAADLCRYGLNLINAITLDDSDAQELAYKSGCIELIKDIITKYINYDDACANGFGAISNIFCCNADARKLIQRSGFIELVRDGITEHVVNDDVCENGLLLFANLACDNPDVQNTIRKLGCIELIKDVIVERIDNIAICVNGFYAISSITSFNPSNQDFVRELGFIELTKDVITNHIDSAVVCTSGFNEIGNIVTGNPYSQKLACELGYIELIFRILNIHKDNPGYAEREYLCLARLLSSQETHAKWCTEDVLRTAEECSKMFKDSQLIKRCLMSLRRVEDPRVADAVSRGVCTQETTSCGKEDCKRKELNCFCDSCVVPQKCFKCFECQHSRTCCETCMKTKHNGHKGAMTFDVITYC